MIKRLSNDHVYNTNATLLVALLTLALGIGGYFSVQFTLRPVVTALETTVVNLPFPNPATDRERATTVQTTWRKRLSARGIPLYVQCRLTSSCERSLRQKPVPYLGMGLILMTLMSACGTYMVNGLLRRKRDVLDNAKWLAMNEWKHPEILRFTQGESRGKGKRRVITDPVIVNLGYVIEQQPMPTNVNPNRVISYKYHDLKMVGLTSKMLQEHVLVYGPTGTGKTSRVLMHFLMAFARRGDAVVLPDFKYPLVAEGFMQAIALFRRMGCNVWPVLPYSPGGYHIPVFDRIRTSQQGRDLAAILVPDLEYGVSNAEFWKQTQQIILGSVFRTVAASTTATFAEVIRIMRMPLEEFGQWLTQSGDSEAIDQLRRFSRMKDSDWNAFTTGILNGLEPFDDDSVNRTFTSVEGKNFDAETFVMQGGLLYHGIPTDMMRTKRGETIMRVFDTYMVNEFVRLRTMQEQTGKQRSIRLMYDEAPSIGRLRNVLKSVATLRAFDVAFIFGIQNESQMKINYGDDIWEAITANLATHIILPTGFKDEAAHTLSRYLGDREIRVVGGGRSQGADVTKPGGTRHSVTVGTQTRALVTPSEIEEWPYFLGILRTKGTLPPALLAMVPLHEPHPEYYGLDGRPFRINNQNLYEDYISIMDDLSLEDRTAEIMDYISETVTEDDLNKHLPTTLKDLFNEWIRFAIFDGTLFRRSNQTYNFMYRSVDASLRTGNAERVVRAFVQSGWLDPGRAIQDSPEDWESVEITAVGLANLSSFVQKELHNVRFLTEYIHKRKELHLRASELSGGFLESQELLPVEAAQEATQDLLRRQDPNLSPEQLKRATAALMKRFKRVRSGDMELVSIPLSFPFEHVTKKIILTVQGREDEDFSTEDPILPPSLLDQAVEHLDDLEREAQEEAFQRAQEATPPVQDEITQSLSRPPAQPGGAGPEPALEHALSRPSSPLPGQEGPAPMNVQEALLPQADADEEDMPFLPPSRPPYPAAPVSATIPEHFPDTQKVQGENSQIPIFPDAQEGIRGDSRKGIQENAQSPESPKTQTTAFPDTQSPVIPERNPGVRESGNLPEVPEVEARPERRGRQRGAGRGADLITLGLSVPRDAENVSSEEDKAAGTPASPVPVAGANGQANRGEEGAAVDVAQPQDTAPAVTETEPGNGERQKEKWEGW